MSDYDYVGQYFDRTKPTYAALLLKDGHINTLSSIKGQEELYTKISNACAEKPLCSLSEISLADDSGDYIGEIYAYSPELLGIVPHMQQGRWLTDESADAYSCVVSALLAEQYPIGSVIVQTTEEYEFELGEWQEKTLEYQVVGILEETERPLNSTFQNGTMALDSLLPLYDTTPFVIVPAEPDRHRVGLTMWFRTDRPVEELQECLQQYGTVVSQTQLVRNYQKNCLETVFLQTPYTLFLLFLSLIIAVSIIVINFGSNRQRYAIMCLLGQSQRMLTGCTICIYTLTLLLAYALSRLCIHFAFPYSLVGNVISISVAHWTVGGILLLSIFCINSVVAIFFHHSPMKLFTENK